MYDFAASASQPFLVMELVEGGTLAERIARGPVPAREATILAGELTSALACVHEAGILHRDIKPANVLIGLDGRARLTDFGIAQPEDATRLTRPGDVIGTIRYLAPEVLAGGAPSVQSDLYALGVLVRELVGETVDRELQAFVERLTAPAAADRPASAEAALAILTPAASAARPLPARAGDGVTQVQRPPAPAPPGARHHLELRLTPRIAVGAAVAVMLLVLVVLTAGGSGGTDGPSAGAGGMPTATSPAPASATPAAVSLDERFDQLDALVRSAAR